MVSSIGVTPRDTIRKILKSIFTRELAIQFSYTGLGDGRKPGKYIFSEHPLCHKILGECN